MSGLGSSAPPPRSPGAEPVTRINRPQGSPDQQAPQQQGGQPGSNANATVPADSAGQNHHDPAVSLAASFARLDRGTLLAGLLAGLSPEGEPVLESPNGTYVISGAGAPLKALATARAVILEIVATERVIEARIVSIDDTRPPGDALVKLALIKPPARQAQPPVATEGPAATGLPSSYRPATAAVPQAPGGGAPPDDPLPLLTRPTQVSAPSPAVPVQPAHAPAPSTSPPLTGPSLLAPRVAVTPPLLADSSPASSPPPVASAANTILGRPLPALVETGTTRPAILTLETVTPPAPSPPAMPTPPPLAGPAAPPRIAPAAAPTAAPTPPVLAGEILPPADSEASPAAPPPTRIATAAGLITLAEPLSLPPGTRVTFSLAMADRAAPLAGLAPLPGPAQPGAPDPGALMRGLPAAPSPTMAPTTAPAIAAPPADAPLPLPQESWPSLSAAMTALAAGDPALAAGVLAKLPAPERLLTPVTLLFLNILGVRNPARLLFGRDGLDRLEAAGRGDLLARVENDVARLRLLASGHGPDLVHDGRSGDWRQILLPLRTEDGLQAIALLVRETTPEARDKESRDGQKRDDGTEGGRTTRFILDLRLKATGRLQFDGLIRDRTFTLILRSEQALPPTPAAHVHGLFQSALAAGGFAGDLLLKTAAPLSLQAVTQAETAPQTATITTA